jgi:CRISPR-associated protein Csm2
MQIEFWKDKNEQIIDPKLYSDTAEELAKKISNVDRKVNKTTQIRKFYDEVLRLNIEAKTDTDDKKWNTLESLVNMLVAKAAYAQGRKLVSDGFVSFMRDSVKQIQDKNDLNIFANFFEAFMGFYKLYRPEQS